MGWRGGPVVPTTRQLTTTSLTPDTDTPNVPS